MAEVSISVAKETEVEELSLLVNSAYRGESSKAGWTTEADLLDGQRTDPESLRQVIQSPGQAILCLRSTDDGPIDGCVQLARFTEGNTLAVHLGMLTVRPSLQAGGLGATLVEKAEEFARSLGAARLELEVIQLRHTLITWYERRGYRKTGETRPFPYGDVKFGVPRREDLHFVVLEKLLAA